MRLHEDMRQAGFYVKTVEDSCGYFAVMDQELVWYGTIHLLGKETAEDSAMRLFSQSTAGELLELALSP